MMFIGFSNTLVKMGRFRIGAYFKVSGAAMAGFIFFELIFQIFKWSFVFAGWCLYGICWIYYWIFKGLFWLCKQGYLLCKKGVLWVVAKIKERNTPKEFP